MRFFRKLLTVVFATAFFVSAPAQTPETDPVVKAMQEELQFNMEQLKAKPVPAYFMSLRMNDNYTARVYSDFGVSGTYENRNRSITPMVRVGSEETDNFKFNSQQRNSLDFQRFNGITVPYTDNAIMAIRQAIWDETMARYSAALTNYSNALSTMQTTSGNEDKAPCFSSAPVEKYYEKPLDDSQLSLDNEYWKERLNRITRVFNSNEFIEAGTAVIEYTVVRTTIVNSEGSVVAQNRKTVRLMFQCSIRAEDGMVCPMHRDWFAFSPDDMPDDETLIATAEDMVRRLTALREAPVADPYSGPAIMSGSASGVFFHEIFGHRLEAHRMKSGGQTFKKMVGEMVLPADFQVFDDPSLKEYAGTDLNGHYLFDDEAVRAQRVDCVKDGVLSNFLMDRVPIEGFPASNGHGRAAQGLDPVSRQSNLVIETTHPYSDAELRAMLIDALRKEGKEYGYFFATASSGMTYTGEGRSINSFGVDPVEVYRVYTDGRPDQLVRGVTLIGTPLAMFSEIAAGGGTPVVFTGFCGAESGQVPVTAISPSIFINKIETQRTGSIHENPMILPRPEQKDVKGDDATILFTAMEDEMARSMSGFGADGQGTPCLIEYQTVKSQTTSISASLGGLVHSSFSPDAVIASGNIILGDKECSSLPFSNGINLGEDVDYNSIRRGLWSISDRIYKNAIRALAQKKSIMEKYPKPDDEKDIPEILSIPGGEIIMDSPADLNIDRKTMEDLCQRLSAVYLDYPELYPTDVNISIVKKDIYKVNSDGLRLFMPAFTADISTSASVRTKNGTIVSERGLIPFDLQKYDADELCRLVDEFARAMMAKKDAESINDFYIGPVLLEKEAASDSFEYIIRKYNCARNKWDYRTVEYRYDDRDDLTGSMILGKRFLDPKINIHFYSDLESYKGRKLPMAYEIDVEGVRPEHDFTFVENGILKNLLSGRYPAVGSNGPSGCSILRGNYSPSSEVKASIVHVTMDKPKPADRLKAQLIAEARKAGLDHAYVITGEEGSCLSLVQIDVKTGKETLIDAEVPDFDRKEFMHVISSSKEEFIDATGNTNSIVPERILLESVEMNIKKPVKAQEFQLINPALR